MAMAIHELDELAGRRRIGFPLAGDGEETAVRVEVPSRSGGILFAQCVVVHDGSTVLDVRLPVHHLAIADAAGMPANCTAFEGFLEVLARIEFARRGGR